MNNNIPQMEVIVGDHTNDTGGGGDQLDDLSADEYSYQEGAEETRQRPNRAPSMNLRYTGARIPGRGFDGGVGKSIIYKDGLQRELTLQEVIDILSNPDLTKLSTMPPTRPRGGSMYLYRCPDFETRHDLRSDQYLWCQQGTKKMPKEDPVVKRFFMYIRTEEPIRNVSKRPKKTFTKYNVSFKKYEYELINAEDPLVLVQYVGDETVWKPFRNRKSTDGDDMIVRTLNNPRGLHQTILPRPPPVVMDVYETDPRDRDLMRSYLKFHSRSRANHVGTLASSKRPRSIDAASSSGYDEPGVTAEHIVVSDVSYEIPSDLGAIARLDAAYAATPLPSTSERIPTIGTALKSGEVRSKFNSLWTTFEACKKSKMKGFVHRLTVIPQLVIIGGSKALLNLANDLAQFNNMKKSERFEFYYVSAGPIAGGYYLSTLLCRHCLFELEPVIPVAYLVHERRRANDHRMLFELIKAKCPDIVSSECVFITDREFGDIKSVLPKAVQLFSWHYFEDDIANWVDSIGGSIDEASGYVNDIFQLMKSKTLENFIRDLSVKRKQWPSEFANYFDNCLKADIASKGGRWQAEAGGTGVYDPFCGVVIPSCNELNQLVGDLVKWQEATLDNLLSCLYYFGEYYVRECEMGMHNTGGYRLKSRYVHLARPTRRLRAYAPLQLPEPRDVVNYVRSTSFVAR